ncbi:hypothetical protein M409DRAFT_62395 [Zasmidium cellare ATCC 36951]|uniref:Methyltransferase domain-containing protein n=1 Tax=Zasmidium cellare ATCC 36951 TaxID=1080233 RepID=A0A6A6CZH6_ZASCE|nr:uncharacterized protein M409DRAFT_62395 [Zasmidium cellare ATCC 36951]KAF2172637.1 hypothetical protein M409DRAFT_62395 [Zasmidium cellare ATCC 36951]
MPTSTEELPTYHSNESAPYVLPNDAAEQERLNRQHDAIVAMLKDVPFHAPLPSTPTLRSALDIGCGTGTTTHLLAAAHPQAKIHGIDLTPIPSSRPKPSNLEFTTGEIRFLVNEGKVKRRDWSYIFSRMLFLGMTDWAAYIALLYDLLEPGGWAELQEVEFVMRDASGEVISQDWRWLNAMTTSLARKGLDTACASKISGWMRDAGFVNVRVGVYVWSWSKEGWEEHPESAEIGRYSVDVLRREIGRMAPRLWDGIGKSEGEVQELYGELRDGLEELGKGAHMRYYVVCGRKP